MPELKGIETSRWRDADIEVKYLMLEGSEFYLPVMSIVLYIVEQLFLR